MNYHVSSPKFKVFFVQFSKLGKYPDYGWFTTQITLMEDEVMTGRTFYTQQFDLHITVQVIWFPVKPEIDFPILAKSVLLDWNDFNCLSFIYSTGFRFAWPCQRCIPNSLLLRIHPYSLSRRSIDHNLHFASSVTQPFDLFPSIFLLFPVLVHIKSCSQLVKSPVLYVVSLPSHQPTKRVNCLCWGHGAR